MKISLSAHVYARTDAFGEVNYQSFSSKNLDPDLFGIYIGPVEFEYEVPADFNPVASEVAALEVKKAEALESYQRTLMELNERISKLQAITYEG